MTDTHRFSHGDRIRYATTDDDGFPLVRYGFVGGVTDDGGPVVVMLDGELGGDVVDLDTIEPVSICNVTLKLDGSDLLDDPTLQSNPQRELARARLAPIVAGITKAHTYAEMAAKLEALDIPPPSTPAIL